jgi:TonB-dependent SusC/RagA subfamily outer membrane receptor
MKTFKHISLIAVILLLAIAVQTSSANNSSDTKKNKKIKISGVVTDANMNPISGALIFVDQVYTNTVTDSKGRYRVRVDRTAKQISAFSRLYGVQKLEIKSDLSAMGNAVINIMLADVNTSLIEQDQKDDEMINDKVIEAGKKENEMINIGYGTVQRKNVNTEVNRIEGQRNYHTYNNVYDMLRGEVPGVEVIGKNVKIRDSFSFYLSTEPLFVVDGMIVTQLDDISPSDVKSIEVLKGASASVYGARGGNGVILITTMKGGDK